MKNERVDIVDKDNNILYQTTKEEAHKRGLLHRTVIAELITSKGEWILVKQASDRQDAGQYVSPMGGHVSAGESEEEALKREVKEELGLINFPYKYIGKAMYQRKVIGRDENHYFILYETYSDTPPTLNHEAVSYKAFSQTELKRALKNSPKQFGAAFIFVVERFYPELLKG